MTNYEDKPSSQKVSLSDQESVSIANPQPQQQEQPSIRTSLAKRPRLFTLRQFIIYCAAMGLFLGYVVYTVASFSALPYPSALTVNSNTEGLVTYGCTQAWWNATLQSQALFNYAFYNHPNQQQLMQKATAICHNLSRTFSGYTGAATPLDANTLAELKNLSKGAK